ncbi:mpeU, partial [Symbiodinium necroappetens]
VEGRVWDSRFRVVHEDLQEPGSCGIVTRREYRSVGEENSGCGRWCQHYVPRAGRYDVAVAHSASVCFQYALDLLNVSALHNALFMIAGATKNECLDQGWLSQAIQLNFSAGVKELLHWGASPDNSSVGATPLQTAAAHGNIGALRQVLNASTDVAARTEALVAAGSHCHAEALELLADHGATVANSSKCDDSILLRVVKEHAMKTEACQQKAQGATVEGTARNYTALWDVLSALRKMNSASYNDCRGLALRKALARTDLGAVKLLLDGVKNVDQLAGAPPLAKSLANLLSAKTFTDDVFLKAATLLHAHGMDLEPKKKALLPFAAERCNVGLVKGLLDLGADPGGLYRRTNASVWADKCPEIEKEAIQSELRKQAT